MMTFYCLGQNYGYPKRDLEYDAGRADYLSHLSKDF